jgi:Holliday junction DNA helicase RuvA
MISRLRGKIAAQEKDFLIIDVQGVGYKVYVPQPVIQATVLGEDILLHTHLSIRESAHELFGFASAEELRFFELLLGVSGIGPRSALGILALADVQTLAAAVSQADTSYLTKVSGIGKKNAEKIVLELKDKVGDFSESAAVPEGEADTLEALRSMGYTSQEARAALSAVPRTIDSPNERLKAALRNLAH